MFAPTTTHCEEIAAALRGADLLVARALDLLSRTDIQAETGLSAETFLALEVGCTGTDARMYAKAAAALRTLPLTRAAVLGGKLSLGQVRQIVTSARSVDVLGGVPDRSADRGAGPSAG